MTDTVYNFFSYLKKETKPIEIESIEEILYVEAHFSVLNY